MIAFDDYLNNTNAPATGTPRAGVYSSNDKAIAEAAFNAGMERAAEIITEIGRGKPYLDAIRKEINDAPS